MDSKPQHHAKPAIAPRLIIHGGAGNITPSTLPPERWAAYREALLGIVTKTAAYMHAAAKPTETPPAALDIATFAVKQLEDNPLFNSSYGAVFTRDGINELEASVMVSRGHAKRGVGVTGLRHVRNPILLAKAVLEHGDADLGAAARAATDARSDNEHAELDVPSAQGHTLVHGEAAEILARKYGLDLVEQRYFFTQARWDEHVRALRREREGTGLSSWSADEYLPQGTVGAVALDADGVVACATSTGGITNKLTGRIGDTPVVGAGFWAEEWVEDGDPTAAAAAARAVGSRASVFERMVDSARQLGPVLEFSGRLRGLLADCLPTPFVYSPVATQSRSKLSTTRSIAVSGTGNGDSFMRVGAARTVGSIARFAAVPASEAVARVTGPSGELQKSAGSRWGRTGEGEGGIIGIESVVVTDEDGNVVETRSSIIQDLNCGGMFRAWIDEAGRTHVKAFRKDGS